MKARYDDGKEHLEKLKKDLAEAEKQTSDDDVDAGVSAARNVLADKEKVF